jgi:hypothetical protein
VIHLLLVKIVQEKKHSSCQLLVLKNYIFELSQTQIVNLGIFGTTDIKLYVFVVEKEVLVVQDCSFSHPGDDELVLLKFLEDFKLPTLNNDQTVNGIS